MVLRVLYQVFFNPILKLFLLKGTVSQEVRPLGPYEKAKQFRKNFPIRKCVCVVVDYADTWQIILLSTGKKN